MTNRRLSALFLSVFALTACDDETTGVEARLLRGPEVAMGRGAARTEVTLDPAGHPTCMAIVLTEDALTGLPDLDPAGFPPEFVLPLPAEVRGQPFDHATVNWLFMGHPPAGIYTAPHLDIHFYLITPHERSAIVPDDPQFAAKVAREPAAGFAVPDYQTDMTGIPYMGVHWTDRNAPEFHGHPFTRSFIYGYWDGTLIFIEPMTTLTFLQTRPDVTAELKVPSRYPRAGFYPTRWAVRFDADRREYRVELIDFVSRS